MKNGLFLLVFGLFGFGLFAQPTIQWQKCIGGTDYDQGNIIQKTTDGGYIDGGLTYSDDGDIEAFNGLVDYFVVKLNSLGSIEWTQTLGGSNDDRAYTIIQTSDGGYIAAGLTQSDDGDVLGFHGDKDAWVVKLNNEGMIEWQKSLGGSGWDEARSVIEATDGGYAVAGRSSSIDGDAEGNHGLSDFWVVKLTSTGTIEWQKSYGGSNEDLARSIKQTSDGGYILAGATKSTDVDVSNNNGNVDFWIVKLGYLGAIEWETALGGLGADYAGDIIEVSNGYVVCGYTGSGNTGDVTGHQGLFDYWIVKLNKSGALVWQKTYGGSDGDWGRSIIQTSDGMYVVAGETKSKNGDVVGNNGIQVAWVLKLDTLGELIWKKPLGGTQGEGGLSIVETNDLGLCLAGYAWSNNGDVSGNHGEQDMWIVKLSPETTSATHSPQALLSIAPNPASTAITLQIPSPDHILQISISDLLGRTLSRQTIANGGQADVSSLPSGLYLVSAATESGQLYVGKLLKG
jgi:Secretion system C-terminal sorting domain